MGFSLRKRLMLGHQNDWGLDQGHDRSEAKTKTGLQNVNSILTDKRSGISLRKQLVEKLTGAWPRK